MRAFVFNGVKYFKLNETFSAFADDFNGAIEAVKSKNFLSYIKQFGKDSKKIMEILCYTRYIENAVSMLIYHFTSEHRFIIFGNEYKSIEEISKNVTSEGFSLFARELCFSKTIINSINDQKQKLDWLTYEKNHQDPFVLQYMSRYYEFDVLDFNKVVVEQVINKSFFEVEDFFSNDEILLTMSAKYSLAEVLNIRKSSCRVFDSLKLIQTGLNYDIVSGILGEQFYLYLADNLNKYKFKGKKAKEVKREIKKINKLLKKSKGLTINFICDKHKKLYESYLEFRDLFNANKIVVINNDNYKLDINYYGMLVCRSYVEQNGLINIEESNIERNKIESNKYQYDIVKFDKMIKKHKRFNRINIFFVILFALYFGFGILAKEFNIKYNFELFKYMDEQLIMIVYLGCLAGISLFTIIQSFLVASDVRRYNNLCRFSYYENNTTILKDKEIDKHSKLTLKEIKTAKKLKRGHRIFTTLSLACLSLVVTILVYSNCINLEIVDNASHVISDPYIYLMVIPAGLHLIFGLFNRKKSWLSGLMCVIFSAVLAASTFYLVSIILV